MDWDGELCFDAELAGGGSPGRRTGYVPKCYVPRGYGKHMMWQDTRCGRRLLVLPLVNVLLRVEKKVFLAWLSKVESISLGGLWVFGAVVENRYGLAVTDFCLHGFQNTYNAGTPVRS